MKTLLITFWLLLLGFNAKAFELDKYDYQDYKKIECVKELEKSLGLESERYFDIEGCSNEQIEKDLTRFLLISSGYQFEWFEKSVSTFESAKNLLLKDHRRGDGDGPVSMRVINSLSDFYESDQSNDLIEVGEFADSYMSGTGITALVLLYNKEKTRLILIQKFIYAE